MAKNRNQSRNPTRQANETAAPQAELETRPEQQERPAEPATTERVDAPAQQDAQPVSSQANEPAGPATSAPEKAPVVEPDKPAPAANVPEPPGVIPVLQGVICRREKDSLTELGRIELRTGFTIELQQNECLQVKGASRPTTIEGGDVGFKSTPVMDAAGNGRVIATMTCERQVFERAEADLLRRSRITGELVTEARTRKLVRSVVNNCDRFNGRAASMAGLNLSHYG